MILSLVLGLGEAPRELSEGILLWMFGFYMGRKHLVLPARRRHEEIMAAHRKIHEHLGIEN